MRPLPGLVLIVCCLVALPSAEPDLEALAREAATNPTSIPQQVTYAEACLQACRLERSLQAFRSVLRLDPEHVRARTVIDRLTAQALDLDSHLEVLDELLRAGPIKDIGLVLDAAATRAASESQQAQVRFLRGTAALRDNNLVAARAQYLTVLKVHPHTPAAAAAAGALARLADQAGQDDQADRLFTQALDHPAVTARVRQSTLLDRARWRGKGNDLDRRIGLLTSLGEILDDVVARRAYHETLVPLLLERHPDGQAAVESLAHWQAVLADDEAISAFLDLAETVGRAGEACETALAALEDLVGKVVCSRPRQVHQRDLLRVEIGRRRLILAPTGEAVTALALTAEAVLATIDVTALTGAEARRTRNLAETLLMARAQKLASLDDAAAALPVLRVARTTILEQCGDDPEPGATARLQGIGRLFEGLREWELAADHDRRLALRFPHLPLGRDALLRQAEITERYLRDNVGALELYAIYAGRYPAELTYRQMRLGERLRRLGFVSVVDFQRRNLLPADGVFGPDTRRRLEELETTFDQIALEGSPAGTRVGILLGTFVHPRMYAIARSLEHRGQHHTAIAAYRLFLNLFPTKQEADDALLAIARIFSANGLFEEALGAYRQLMDDFPKGDCTSEAYVEGARCLIDLGRWADAKELLALYVKKFPRKQHVAVCQRNMAALTEIMQYADFIDGNPDHPKLAEARYQIGAILYQRLESPRRAAVEFATMAAIHPQHIRAADALYTAGTAWLHLEDFPAARAAFTSVVTAYADNRLADDAQYWIGHSFEYQARALGKLDAARIVLKRRSLRARRTLLANLALRRLYHPQAALIPAPANGTDDVYGILAEASVQDRVGEDLRTAIAAYRKVVDDFQLGDKAGNALLRIGIISTDYLKNTEKGVAAYRELLSKYPGSKEAVDALYNVGAHQRETGEYDEAIASYKKFIFSYPEAAQVQKAMVDIATCYAAKKQWDQALDAYKSYLNKFPRGDFAVIAQAQIDWIRMYYF